MSFMESDLQARAMLVKAAFDLFTVMQRRSLAVRQPLPLHASLPCTSCFAHASRMPAKTRATKGLRLLPSAYRQMRMQLLGNT